MKSVIFSIICVLLITLFSSCKNNTAKVDHIPSVKTDTVIVYGEEDFALFPGKVKSASEVNLSFKVSGTIESIPNTEGKYVPKGGTLATMDSRDYTIQFQATEAEYKQIKNQAERVFQLYEKNSVTLEDYEKAKYGLQQISAKYSAHRNSLNDTRLTAPFDCYVKKIYYSPKETVGAGMPVIQVINKGNYEIEINIPASVYEKRNLFKSFECSFDGKDSERYPLRLISISPSANLNQLYTVRLGIEKQNNNFSATAGISTSVYIKYISTKSTLTEVALSAIFEDKDRKSCVWVYNVENKIVLKREVKVESILSNGNAVISSGLSEGEIVVAGGTSKIREGMDVVPLKPISKTNVGGLL